MESVPSVCVGLWELRCAPPCGYRTTLCSTNLHCAPPTCTVHKGDLCLGVCLGLWDWHCAPLQRCIAKWFRTLTCGVTGPAFGTNQMSLKRVNSLKDAAGWARAFGSARNWQKRLSIDLRKGRVKFSLVTSMMLYLIGPDELVNLGYENWYGCKILPLAVL